MAYFKKVFGNRLQFNWSLGLFLILLFGVPRFMTVLHANKTSDYSFTSIIFMVMWILPFLLLNKSGRKEIGLNKLKGISEVFLAFLAGGLLCTAVWSIGVWLYGDTPQNWMVYISRSYQVPTGIDFEALKFQYFLIFAITSMLFSPIGEEFLYRGMIHRCFSGKFGDNRASIVDSAAFAITHLAHFGILFVDGRWIFTWVPAILWVVMMFLASRIFFVWKQKSHSIWGAVACHAGFNLMMTYFIFYHIF